MSKYLVTGCAGFIGARVCQQLLEQGEDVVGLDNLNTAYDVRLKLWRLTKLQETKNFFFNELDICDPHPLRQLFEDSSRSDGLPFDGVINLAARAGVRYSVENPKVYFESNVDGLLNLLDTCVEFGVTKLVQASSSSVYGDSNKVPFDENDSTLRPLSPYAASKVASEGLCHSYHHLYGLDVTVLRYFTVYGPAGRPDMAPFRFVQWVHEGRPLVVFGDGSQLRDFTYVDDIARGTILSLKPMGFEIVNLGSGQPFVLSKAIELIEDLSGKKAQIEFKPLHDADVSVTHANAAKAETLLGWRSEVTLEEGLQHLVKWYQENRVWLKDIETL